MLRLLFIRAKKLRWLESQGQVKPLILLILLIQRILKKPIPGKIILDGAEYERILLSNGRASSATSRKTLTSWMVRSLRTLRFGEFA